MRGGGDGSFGGCSESLGKNFRMPPLALAGSSSPATSNSSSEGTGDNEDKDESSEESSSADMLAVRVVVRLR